MKTLIKSAFAASLMLGAVVAQPALAQSVAAGKIATVDLDRIARECTACKTANTALQQQIASFEARRNQLASQLQPEAQYLDGAVKALSGKQPDATLAQRIKTFQTNDANASQEMQNMQGQIQRNQQYIGQQIQQKLQPLYMPAMTKRGANVLIEVGQTLSADPQLDITTDVLAALNATLTTIATTAPAPQAAGAPAAAPTGR